MTVSNYVRLQNILNNELIRNDLWTMAICGQHRTMRILNQSALTIGPWRLGMNEIGNRKPRSKNKGSFWYAISANRISQGKTLNEGKARALGH